MPDPVAATGAIRTQTRYGALGMGARQFTGLWTQRSPFRDAAVEYLISKFYSGSRFDSILDGLNREITVDLTDKRRPGLTVYNSQAFPAINSFYPWKYIQNGEEVVRVMVDGSDGVLYDGTGPSTKLNIWNKAPNAGPTRFLGVNTELFFSDGVEQKKIVESALTWEPNTLYDGAATSDEELGDFIIDTNSNIQQAVGGFTLLISNVQIASDVLTLTLDTSQLSDPSGTPTGTASTTGGALAAGNNYIRIAGVDATGNVTEAGNESAAVATTGTTGSILWTWPAISGAVSYQIYVSTTPGGETTYFTSAVNSFTQVAQTSTVSGTPPVSNNTSVEVPDNLFQMVGVELALSGLTTATFLNGQTVTITAVLPGGMASNQITAAFTHADYASAADTGTATSGTGITGATQPTWANTLWAVTQDGGAQWINRGSYVQNWGIATPAAAPTVVQTRASTTTYPLWQPNTFYWPSRCCYVTVSGATYIMLLTNSGTTSPTQPTWDISAIGNTTPDNTAVWTYEGPTAWAASTAYAKGAYTTFQPTSGGLQVYIALNAGTSGTAQTGWTGGVGALVTDNTIQWQCLGTIIPYLPSGVSTTVPLALWPTSGSLSFRNSFTVTPATNTVIYAISNLYQTPTVGSPTTISGCANSALNGTGTILAVNVPLPYTTGLIGIEVAIPFSGSYHPYTDMVGGTMQYSEPGGGLTPSVQVAQNEDVLDSNGYIEQIQDPGGFSGPTQPTWAAIGAFTDEDLVATITAYAINAGVATLTAANRFVVGAGTEVTIAGLTSGTALNGTWALETANDTEFSINTTAGDIGTTSDNGTASTPGGAAWLNIGAFAPVSTAPTFYVYSYGNSVTSHVGSSSNQTASVLLRAGYLANVQGFGSADPQVDTIWIFRPPQGESTPLLVDKIANPGGGVPWSYLDNIPDADLNAEIAAPQNGVNDPPPANATAPEQHLERNFIIVKNQVRWSGGPDTLVGSGNEAFWAEDYIAYVAQPIRLVSVTVQDGGLLVFTTSGIHIILGSGTANDPFQTYRYFGSVNLLNYNELAVYNTQIFLMESNRKVSSIAIEYPFNPQSGYTEIGFPIGDQFKKVTTGGINAQLYDAKSGYVSWNIQDTEETGMYVSDGAVGWFRMGVVSPPESGLVWSPRAAIVGGTSAVQSIETTAGNHQLLIGPPSATPGPILTRDATGTAWSDNGTAYPAWDDKGLNLLCSTGQWCEVVHVAAKSAAAGLRPLVSILLGEIKASATRPWKKLPLSLVHNDPADTPQSESYYSDRYETAQGGMPMTGDCILTRFDYGTQAEPDELLDWSMYAKVTDEREEQAEKAP